MPEQRQENLLKKRLLERINQVSEEDLDDEVDFTEAFDNLNLEKEDTNLAENTAVEATNNDIELLKQELAQAQAAQQELLQKNTQLENENKQLKQASSASNNAVEGEHLEELRKELQNALKEKSDLEIQVGRLRAVNDKYLVQKDVLEAEVKALQTSYQEKDNECEAANQELRTLRSATSGNASNDAQLTELLQAKQQVNDLLFKNQALQEEAIKSQQEIGEVMVSAKKEATRIVSEAKVEAKHIINSAELEMLNIGNRAKTISNEVEESKNEVMGIYHELEERLNKLSRLDKSEK
ncbi:regulator of replication initiation timing [Enterococcus sp. PF1-24]|uniref:hypothetical protein n=1 Tax=unclassified Enterococcus TaxID=2608891 RepID=UPI0024764581|nr:MULTISPECIES: hypothetical protein [unclassified Enterococcus]MDH6363565.1 regulator of replication initiation timing [Enterococcus sp. PFB1-1]MDH6400800.1 regulator of replication initiation timing [Enterococcus sp. PF1-24]